MVPRTRPTVRICAPWVARASRAAGGGLGSRVARRWPPPRRMPGGVRRSRLVGAGPLFCGPDGALLRCAALLLRWVRPPEGAANPRSTLATCLPHTLVRRAPEAMPGCVPGPGASPSRSDCSRPLRHCTC